MREIKISLTVQVPDDTDDVDVQYGVGNVLDEDAAFQLNCWEVTMVSLDTGIIRHGAGSDCADWLAKHPGKTEADYQQAIETAGK